MDIFDKAPHFTFKTKTDGEKFIQWLKNAAYKYDVVPMNDILVERLERTVPDGFRYGYDRSEIKKLKVRQADGFWQVDLPKPSRMIRDKNGHWTTENILKPESIKKGGA